MVYLPGNEATRTVMNWNKWRSQLSRDEIAEYLTKTDHKKCKNTQNIHIARWALNLSTFWGVSSRKKNIFLYPEIGQSFEESTRGDKLVKYLPDIFIEFGFCMMWRIIQILEAVIHLGLITISSICIILHIILRLSYIQLLLNIYWFLFKIMIVPESMDLMIWFKPNPAPLITTCCLRSFNILHWRTDSVTLTPVWYDMLHLCYSLTSSTLAMHCSVAFIITVEFPLPTRKLERDCSAN